MTYFIDYFDSEYGGIYLDTDVIVVRSFDPLRLNYSVVLGRETGGGLNNGIIVGRRNAPFLRIWLEAYRSYQGEREVWGYTPVILPHRLAEIFPHLVHVEERSIARPNWTPEEMERLYNGTTYNWTSNYCVHWWSHVSANWMQLAPRGLDDVGRINSTLGQVVRHALYGGIS